MATIKISQTRFQCPKLRHIALVKIEQRVEKSAEDPTPIPLSTRLKDCDGKLRCGIAKATSPTSWAFDWPSCPAYVSLSSRGSL